MRSYDFIIVGAGSAGRTAAETLIREVPSASLNLVDAENALPYKRTQVSKHVKSGMLPDEFAIHEETWYSRNNVDLQRGLTVEDIIPDARQIVVGGEKIAYKCLLLATGARPRIPFIMPAGKWSTLWTEDDGRTLNKKIPQVKEIIVAGAGVLGVEAAWQLTEAGLHVTLIGRSEYPLAEYLDSMTANLLTRKLSDAGVDLVFGQSIEEVRLIDGGGGLEFQTREGKFSADYGVLTLGSEPEIRLAQSAGLDIGRGIAVDSSLRTSQPHIWAAGDCAEHPDGTTTGLWRSAEEQGHLAALSMLGRKVKNENPPYRLKCEVFGGFWFSAGPVAQFKTAETWEVGTALWRPCFVDGHLAALSIGAPEGLTMAPLAQDLVLERAERWKVERAVKGI